MGDMVFEGAPGIAIRLDGTLLRVMLDRPDKQNALTDESVGAFIRTLEALHTDLGDDVVRAVLVTGAGENFCGGFDIVARNAPRDTKPVTASIQRRLPVTAHRLIPLVLSTQVPIVAAVRGWTVGIGMHLALAADFCIAAEDARFWEPFLTRGFTPDSGATWMLPRLVGVARAKELLMLGRRISGGEAAAMGLIHRAVPADEVEPTAEALARELAAGPTVALGLTKWLIHTGSGLDIDRHLANEAFAMELSSRSPDFREGMAAMKERRAPEFGGR
jgi:2-(1,2-epoxy-1,2-dihydrophenyl)acetyl-CoA isomerase